MSTLLQCSLLLLISVLHFLPFVLACPRACFCNMISKVVHCSERKLRHIPFGIPTDAMQLNLNGNGFESTTLKRINFTAFGLLEHLYLSKCNIRAIEVGTFIDLSRLKWLDLSKNQIRDLQDFTFRGLNLDNLFLNGNENLMLHKDTFSGLKVKGLYLQSCGLTEVSLEILKPVNDTLSSLSLDDNDIRRVGREMFYIFSSLQHLRLHSNPLHCNCELAWLKQFYDKKPKVFSGQNPPSCLTPKLANGETFRTLTQRDFRCQRPIFNGVDLVFANEEGTLRCIAGGDPAPTIYWIKPNGERNAYPPPHPDFAAKTEALMKISHEENMYRGSYRCLAMNSGGNVTLTMNVTWPKIEKQTIIKYIDREPRIVDTEHRFPIQKDATNGEQEKSSSKANKNNNKVFTMLDLVSAVLGTFASTLIVCVIVFHLIFRMRLQKLQLNELNHSYVQNGSVYLARQGDELAYATKDGIYSYPR